MKEAYRFSMPWPYLAFLAWNWGPAIAWRMGLDEWYGQRKYGLAPARFKPADALPRNHDATLYMPASYTLLESIFNRLAPLGLTRIVDVGAGEGRPLEIAAHFGFNQLTAIEFDPELAATAAARLQAITNRFTGIQYQVWAQAFSDVIIPPNTELIFLFNPFGAHSMDNLISQLEKQIPFQQSLQVIYINPVEADLWETRGYQRKHFEKRGRYLEYLWLERIKK